jgi:hypothetical protein
MSSEERQPLLMDDQPSMVNPSASARAQPVPTEDDFSDLDPEILRASAEDIITRTRLLDNDIKVGKRNYSNMVIV